MVEPLRRLLVRLDDTVVAKVSPNQLVSAPQAIIVKKGSMRRTRTRAGQDTSALKEACCLHHAPLVHTRLQLPMLT